MTTTRPEYRKVLKFARLAVSREAGRPTGWSYDRQSVMHEVLNHFAGLTNSHEDEDFILEAVREAESEYNEDNGVEL